MKRRPSVASAVIAKRKQRAKRSTARRWRRVTDLFFALALDWLLLQWTPTRIVGDVVVGALCGAVAGCLPFYLARRKQHRRLSFWLLAISTLVGTVSTLVVTTLVALAMTVLALRVTNLAPAPEEELPV